MKSTSQEAKEESIPLPKDLSVGLRVGIDTALPSCCSKAALLREGTDFALTQTNVRAETSFSNTGYRDCNLKCCQLLPCIVLIS